MPTPSIVYLCINLPRAEDRRRAIQAQALKHGLDIQLVTAIAGEDLPAEVPEYDRAARRRCHNHDLTPNEIACTLSHIKALKTFLASDAEYAVIMEDDALLAENFSAGIRELTDHLQGWEIAKLYTPNCKLYPLSANENADAPIHPVFHKNMWYAVGFMYTRRGAEALLEGMSPFCTPADGQIVKALLGKQIPTIAVTPNLITTSDPDGTHSTIDSKEYHRKAQMRRRSFSQYLAYRCDVIDIALGKKRMRRLMSRLIVRK